MEINELAATHFGWVEQMGWHNKTPLEALALVASEVGEAINECRGIEPTEHFAEELADIMLRVLDLAHWHNIDIEQTLLAKMAKNQQRGNRGREK
jgi:NTP pyrophosphatase (non-canonical NTP hydrolase)